MSSKRQIEEAIEDKKAFKQQPPDRIIKRMLVLQHIHREHTPDECEAMVPGTMAVEQLFDEEGKEALFFNWEFMLFSMPMAELEFMAERLYLQSELDKKKQEIVSGIVNAQTQDEIEKRRAQGLTMSEDEIIELKLKAAQEMVIEEQEINLEPTPIKAWAGGLVDILGNPL